MRLQSIGSANIVKTYPECDANTGLTIAFEIDMVYIRLATVVRVLSSVPGVSDVRKRRMFSKWEEIHAWFQYRNAACVVWEPFGDNSRFWIGQKGTLDKVDLSEVERAFKDYQPPICRRLMGDIVTLQFLKSLLGRDAEWRRINPPPP